MAWLKADLAAVDRSRTPWLIVGMHAPWYNSNTAHSGEVEDMRQSMEALLYSYGVDLVFAGEHRAVLLRLVCEDSSWWAPKKVLAERGLLLISLCRWRPSPHPLLGQLREGFGDVCRPCARL